VLNFFGLLFRSSSDITSLRIKENPPLILNDAMSDDLNRRPKLVIIENY
jgi:hypothetical protein